MAQDRGRETEPVHLQGSRGRAVLDTEDVEEKQIGLKWRPSFPNELGWSAK